MTLALWRPQIPALGPSCVRRQAWRLCPALLCIATHCTGLAILSDRFEVLLDGIESRQGLVEQVNNGY
jgi:hypothetical protein